MSETVKLIIEIPKGVYEMCKDLWVNDAETLESAVAHGIPLDNHDSDYAEAQAYFAGESYGWEEGRKALIDDVKAEINEEREFARDDFRQYKIDYLGVDPETADDEYPNDEFHKGMERAVDIINQHIGKGDKE